MTAMIMTAVIMTVVISYDSRDYDSYDYDIRDYDSRDYDIRDYDSRDYDSRDYDSLDYDSRDYDSLDYDSHDYDSLDYVVIRTAVMQQVNHTAEEHRSSWWRFSPKYDDMCAWILCILYVSSAYFKHVISLSIDNTGISCIVYGLSDTPQPCG